MNSNFSHNGLTTLITKMFAGEKYLAGKTKAQYGVPALLVLAAFECYIVPLVNKHLSYASIQELESYVQSLVVNMTEITITLGGISCASLDRNQLLLHTSNGTLLLDFATPGGSTSIASIATEDARGDITVAVTLVRAIIGLFAFASVRFWIKHIQFWNPFFSRPWDQEEERRFNKCVTMAVNILFLLLYIFIALVCVVFKLLEVSEVCQVGLADVSSSSANDFLIALGSVCTILAVAVLICIGRDSKTLEDIPEEDREKFLNFVNNRVLKDTGYIRRTTAQPNDADQDQENDSSTNYKRFP